MSEAARALGDRRGVMLVVSSPSGAGKTTLTRRLLESDSEVELSISVTTRARRGSEIDGRDYHFICVETFERMRADGDLLEWAEVHGNFYATPRAPVEKALSRGRDILFDIDWQGAAQLRERAPSDVVGVFILPPSVDELARRLHTRAEDTEEVINRRLAGAAAEIRHWDEYDHVIVNADLEVAFNELCAILRDERDRRQTAAGNRETKTAGARRAIAGRSANVSRLAGQLLSDLEARVAS